MKPDRRSFIKQAAAVDTVLTICFQDGWSDAPHRVLRNKTIDMWEAHPTYPTHPTYPIHPTC